MRNVFVVLGLIVGVFLIVRAIVELIVIDYSDPSSYANDWGGPSLAGVLFVHVGPGYWQRSRSLPHGEGHGAERPDLPRRSRVHERAPAPPTLAGGYPERPITNQTPCTTSSPRFHRRWGMVESNAIESPGPSSCCSNPSWTPRRPVSTWPYSRPW